MKNKVLKILCSIVNLFAGMVGIIAFAVAGSFIFEKDNKDHDIQLGVFVLMISLLIVFSYNVLFSVLGKFNIKSTFLYQILPFCLGGALYFICNAYL